MEKHASWDSRAAFILAAIGSAIGLGNVWRFPYIAYKFGGGAFLIPYLVALATAGIPLLILEFSLGHKMRASAPFSFSKIKKNTEWLGWFALLVGFIIVTYYAVVMAWSSRYLISSFTLEWGKNPKVVESFFFAKILGVTKGPFELGKIMWPLLGLLVLMWVWVIASIWKGAKTVSKVVWVTVIAPWVILIIFLIRGVTLPGAEEGLKYFLTPNIEALKDPAVWHAAYSQVFYSLTIGFGVMIAYASFLPRKTDIINNAIIIGLADAGTAFAGGIVVFSTLGYYAQTTGQKVADVVASGPGLAFVTYPMIINKLPLAPVFGVLFFIMLLTLAIDSAFSLVEGAAAGLLDRFKWKRYPTLIAMAVAALFIGVIYITGSGLYWLDIVDHFMNNFGLFAVVLGECIVVGWMWRSRFLRSHSNLRSEVKVGVWWEGMIQWVIPAIILFILSFTVIDRIKAPYGGDYLAEFVGGWLVIGLLAETAIIMSRMQWRKKIPAMLIPPILIASFYGLRFSWIQSHFTPQEMSVIQTPLFLALWWVGIAVLIEIALLLTKMKPMRKLALMLAPPGLVGAFYLVSCAWRANKPQIVILIFTCLVLYGGIVLSLWRSAWFVKKVKRGEIVLPDDKED